MHLEYVKGHSGDVGNDGADYQANRGCELPSRPDRDWEQLEADVRQRLGTAPELKIREPSPELVIVEPEMPPTLQTSEQNNNDISAEEMQVCALLGKSSRNVSPLLGVF